MRLTHEGYDIAGLEVRNGMPVIELVPTARLAEMAHHEHGATYIAHSLCDGVRKRTGELLRRTCRVIWIEKGE